MSGDVYIDGSKNSSLPIICASLMIGGKVKLYNIPSISDVEYLLEIIKLSGAIVNDTKNYIEIDSSTVDNYIFDTSLCSNLRASYYLLGSMVNLFDEVIVKKQGGCNIGDRPIDIHEKVFSSLGYKLDVINGCYKVTKCGKCNSIIHFNHVSMGATINGILCACSKNEKIRLKNVSLEPEIDDLICFLNECGYFIERIGNDIVIHKKRNIKNNVSYVVMYDRIEAGSYALIASLVGNNVIIHNFVKSNNEKLLEVFDYLNVKYDYRDSCLLVSKSSVNSIEVTTEPYPGFPTDLIQMLSILMINGDGVSSFRDTIYKHRYAQLLELIDVGVLTDVYDDSVVVYGNKAFNSGVFYGKDLRGTMSLIMYALKCDGESKVYGLEYLNRGYSNVIDKLLSLGACIEVVEDEK